MQMQQNQYMQAPPMLDANGNVMQPMTMQQPYPNQFMQAPPILDANSNVMQPVIA